MAQKLVQGGIKAVRNGDHDLARKAFTQALKLDPENEAAWLGMATITEADKDKIRILERVLAINPENGRAAEALRRLSGEPENEVPDASKTAELSDEAIVDSQGAVLASGEMQPLTGIASGDTGELSDFPKPDWALDEDVPGVDDDIFADDDISEPSRQVAPLPPAIKTLEIRSSEAMFAELATLPARGQGGVPVPEQAVITEMSQESSESVQAYLEETLSEYLESGVKWTRKSRGRAGSGEYRLFLIQAGVASFVGLVILSTALIAFLLTNATTRRLLLEPTRIPSATPTDLPTITPGVTNTASPTPPGGATETPALPDDAQLAFDDPNFPPTATDFYYSGSVDGDSLLDDALILMEAGQMSESLALIEEVAGIERDTGAFPPLYRLVQWYLANDEPEEARRVIAEWEERFESNSSVFDRNQTLMLIAYSAVDVYEAGNGSGDRASLLSSAERQLEAVLRLADDDNPILVNAPDTVNVDAYLLLAEVHLLRGLSQDALDVLDAGLNASFDEDDIDLTTNTRLRMAKVEILAELEEYDAAFQELSYTLLFNPFLEEALIEQVELALESDRPGLAVLNAQQYLLYYPGSLQGFYLLGQAREAENKYDLALNAYSRAVAGDVEDENYTDDPFFMENLLSRADLLIQQGRIDEAADDFSLALDIAGDNPAIRVRRLQSSYAAGDYERVLLDVEELLEEDDVALFDVLYYQGLTLVDQAMAGDGRNDNYELAIEALNEALPRLSGDDEVTAQEYLAVANLEERNFDDALSAINIALDDEITAYRLYIRAQILEQQNERAAALLDYEVIVTWGQYFAFPFYDDAHDRYDSLLRSIGR